MRHLSRRSELQAAVMSVRLKEQIIKEHESKIQKCSFLTDSATVLQWIHSSYRKQQVFVANRVAGILRKTDVSQWNHVWYQQFRRHRDKNHQWAGCWMQLDNKWLEQVNLTLASDERAYKQPSYPQLKKRNQSLNGKRLAISTDW